MSFAPFVLFVVKMIPLFYPSVSWSVSLAMFSMRPSMTDMPAVIPYSCGVRSFTESPRPAARSYSVSRNLVPDGVFKNCRSCFRSASFQGSGASCRALGSGSLRPVVS